MGERKSEGENKTMDTESSTSDATSGARQGPSRRTLVKGAAWAAPAIAFASAAPMVAASVPPCIGSITNASQNWDVDGIRYLAATCTSYGSHRDVRLQINVTSCANPVRVQVRNVAGNSTWCAWNTGTGTLTKNVAANTSASLVFPATGDTIVGGGGCTITAYESPNDGMHINPCQPAGPYFQYRVSYDSGANWTGWVDWGNSSTVPLP